MAYTCIIYMEILLCFGILVNAIVYDLASSSLIVHVVTAFCLFATTTTSVSAGRELLKQEHVELLNLKIRHSAIVAPVALITPPQRLILGTAHLARLGVDVALKLGWRTTKEALVHIVVVVGGCLLCLCCGGRRVARPLLG